MHVNLALALKTDKYLNSPVTHVRSSESCVRLYTVQLVGGSGVVAGSSV